MHACMPTCLAFVFAFCVLETEIYDTWENVRGLEMDVIYSERGRD